MYRKTGVCSPYSGAFQSLGKGQNGEGAPASQGHAHVHTLSWQHPPWGEASTCPIPEQGAGVVARPQPGRPDSGERNEGGGHSCPGGLAQEAEPSKANPAPNSLLLSELSLASPGARILGVQRPLASTPHCTGGQMKGPCPPAVTHSRSRSRSQNVCRFYSQRGKIKENEHNKLSGGGALWFSKHFLFYCITEHLTRKLKGRSSFLFTNEHQDAQGKVTNLLKVIQPGSG